MSYQASHISPYERLIHFRVDEDILSVTRSMKELWPLAIQGLICQREVKKVLDFYRGHAENSSIGSDHAIHQRLLKISNELLPAVAEAARDLLQKLNAVSAVHLLPEFEETQSDD